MRRDEFTTGLWDRPRRQDLVTLILRFVKQNHEWIYLNHGRALHFRNGSDFFIWHRRLIEAMDSFLQQSHELPALPPATVGSGPPTGYAAQPAPARARQTRPTYEGSPLTRTQGQPGSLNTLARPARGEMIADPLGVSSRIKGFDYGSRGINQRGRPPQGQGGTGPGQPGQSGPPAEAPRRWPSNVRLPRWTPWFPIPQEFVNDPSAPSDPDQPHTATGAEAGGVGFGLGGLVLRTDSSGNNWPNPPLTEAMFSEWSPERIHEWRGKGGLSSMGIVLEWGPLGPLHGLLVGQLGITRGIGPHFQGHLSCGGKMADPHLRTAPEAPIFWPWHAFIDDIYQSWLDRGFPAYESGPGLGGPVGLDGVVPQCIGKNLHDAVHAIRAAGLRTGQREYFNNGNDDNHLEVVKNQEPPASTQLSVGGNDAVHLCARRCWPPNSSLTPKCDYPNGLGHCTGALCRSGR